MAAHLLALLVVVSQPIASLAWLGGMHATLDQAALHQAAVAHGHNHHHGALEHHEHQPTSTKTTPRMSTSPDPYSGREFASAAPYAGPFQDLLQTIFQAMLVVLADTPSPGDPSRGASLAEDLPSQHSPPVPHRPPILLPLTLTIV